MSAFQDNFRPDPELPDLRRLWRTAKPLLRDAVVAVAPPYPEYPKLKVSKKRGPNGDPSCPSARDPGADVEVAQYSASGNGFGGFQERAWAFVLAHPGAIEAALRPLARGGKLSVRTPQLLAAVRILPVPHEAP